MLPSTGLEGAQKVAERLLETIGETPITVEDQTVRITVSIGVARSEPDDIRLETILERADRALYAAKQSGRSSVKVFNG